MYRQLSIEGLWKNNPALVQLLGLCPLLAVTSSVINGLGLGFATTLVLIGSNATVSLIRNWVTPAIRIPVFVMIIAAFVTIIQLLMNAFTYELYLALGIFIPLIVTNCAIIGRAEAFASKNPIPQASFDGLMMGTGFTVILVILGGMRECLGNGTLLSGSERLFGPIAENWQITLFTTEQPFLLAILPPGAFLGMGLLIALKNVIDERLAQRAPTGETQSVVRARVTAEN